MGSKYNFILFGEFHAQKFGDDFLEKYWDYNKNKISPNEIGKGSRIKVWIKCQECNYHDSYEIMAYSFTDGNRCSYCSGKQVHTFDSFGYRYPHISSLWSDKNEFSPYEISYGSGKDIYLKCQDGLHTDYKTKPYRAKEHGFRCPACSKEQDISRLQKKVQDFIIREFGFDMLYEYDCNIIAVNPKRIKNSSMPYDIEVLNGLKLLIEVQGEQHYECSGWTTVKAKKNNTSPQYELMKRKLYDRYKKYIAYKNGYNYLVIPYWFEQNDNYKDLVRHKFWSIILSSDKGDFLLPKIKLN